MSLCVQNVVIGAGVVGLSVARALALRLSAATTSASGGGGDVLVLESCASIGQGTSSRNSEVLHAGLYNPKDWLKTRACIGGREMMYRLCEEMSVPHRRCGKMVVATSDKQVGKLRELKRRAEENGVDGLRIVGRDFVRELEPNVECVEALFSPHTGIVDSHALMSALEAACNSLGVMFSFNSHVLGCAPDNTTTNTTNHISIAVQDTVLHTTTTISCERLINCGGLQASKIAKKLTPHVAQQVPQTHMAKGNYFALNRPAGHITRLVYPLPEDAGLGVHATIDLFGKVRFGPDVEWVEQEDYAVDSSRGDKFYAEIRKYFPSLRDGELQPDYSGIRPKLSRRGEPARDFAIFGPKQHNKKGMCSLLGIESPGLTSCLWLADHVVRMVVEDE